MTLIIFLLILSVLVIVHELGHFLLAKRAGIRVEEFGLGYPPRAKKLFQWGETEFTLNWLPFGGFVKIFGENPTEGVEGPRSFASKRRDVQAAVLVGGVAANLIFAWILLSLGFTLGLPASTSSGLPVRDPHTVVSEVLPNSPAEQAGLKAGDRLLSVGRGSVFAKDSPQAISDFIASSKEPMNFKILRLGREETLSVTPATGVVGEKIAIRVGLDAVGLVKLPLGQAFYTGFTTAKDLTVATFQGLIGLVKQALAGKASLKEVTGPVGIIGLVGEARLLGFSYLLSFTALISINLAVINFFPIPALDGGRLLFVLIEAVRRRKIPPKIFNAVNNVSFALLLILMGLVTLRDISNLL